ncbi:hypothetical protein AVEN_146906-1 [Araneus ventricosus]|uniref:Uncharacterized protein n=1 Tax=Araneus ventricosus TaxID=182803 RepID=A0A4Y2WSQ1_ARAVE|nr:hypothetical protein AVEN_200358-1 [Araneus ventricosus]GBO40433.1 hypothetical protein AVEN_208801-1 [Araneus ventricosus]GBO42182.1 hypothetical protein AVEN_231936-1 [Araneus ventricosus]GBO42184.1 hypothetical protein AVEN_146906-1 [Araneus ventricosus]
MIGPFSLWLLSAGRRCQGSNYEKKCLRKRPTWTLNKFLPAVKYSGRMCQATDNAHLMRSPALRHFPRRLVDSDGVVCMLIEPAFKSTLRRAILCEH